MSSIVPSNGSSPFEPLRQTRPDGSEFWSARDLQPAMAYVEWRKFEDAIERAVAACENSGLNPKDHFGGAAKMVSIGSGASRTVSDWHVSRYAAYLIAMNGDPRKQEIANAQTYFAVKTREAETATPALPQDYEEALVALLGQVRETKALTIRVAELEPAANSWQTLAAAEGDFSVADAAKILARDPNIKLGRNRLFSLLDEYRWTYRQVSDDRPRVMQVAIERQWLSEIPQSHYHPRTAELVMDAPQVRVTAKGLHELHKRLGGSNAVQVGGSR